MRSHSPAWVPMIHINILSGKRPRSEALHPDADDDGLSIPQKLLCARLVAHARTLVRILRVYLLPKRHWIRHKPCSATSERSKLGDDVSSLAHSHYGAIVMGWAAQSIADTVLI
jgi:hypothetical protein